MCLWWLVVCSSLHARLGLYCSKPKFLAFNHYNFNAHVKQSRSVSSCYDAQTIRTVSMWNADESENRKEYSICLLNKQPKREEKKWCKINGMHSLTETQTPKNVNFNIKTFYLWWQELNGKWTNLHTHTQKTIANKKRQCWHIFHDVCTLFTHTRKKIVSCTKFTVTSLWIFYIRQTTFEQNDICILRIINISTLQSGKENENKFDFIIWIPFFLHCPFNFQE